MECLRGERERRETGRRSRLRAAEGGEGLDQSHGGDKIPEASYDLPPRGLLQRPLTGYSGY